MRLKLDMTTILNGAGTLIIVYLVVVLAQTVKRNYDLNLQLTTLKSQISLVNDQKAELAYNLQYYATDSFKEREARAKLGLQLPGESVIILPHVSPTPTPAAAVQGGAKAKSNLRQWLDFLTGSG